MTVYAGLPRATISYLAALSANNRRDWFEANRTAYERDWRDAGLDLIAALAPVCASATPRLDAVPRLNGSLKRLNRDVRFSADKTPYAPMLHLALTVANGAPHAGMHLVIHPDRLSFGAGRYGLDPEALTAFRSRVTDPLERAALLAAARSAEGVGSRWDAPDLKRVPQGWTADPDWDHLLRRKSVILRGDMAVPDWLHTPEAVPGLTRILTAHLPLLGWLVA